MEDKSSLTFSFCGDYEVNALSLVHAIASLVDISNAIAESEYPDVKFELNVKAIAPGSLKFDFVAVVVQAVQNLMTQQNIAYANGLISFISNMFKLKSFLRGEKPKAVKRTDDKIIVENRDGVHLELPAGANVYFVDARVDHSLTQVFQAAKDAGGATAVKVVTDETVEINEDDFDLCAKDIDLNDIADEECIIFTRTNEILYVRQPDFTGDLKWKFVGDQNITASVKDDDFKRKIQSGSVALTSKTYIIADVQVKTPRGKDGLPDTTKTTYEILEVHAVKTVGEDQTKLDV